MVIIVICVTRKIATLLMNTRHVSANCNSDNGNTYGYNNSNADSLVILYHLSVNENLLQIRQDAKQATQRRFPPCTASFCTSPEWGA